MKRDSLTRPPRDETRTTYILQAVESAWEGVDRKKATGARDSATAENPNGIGEEAEVHSVPSLWEECGALGLTVWLSPCWTRDLGTLRVCRGPPGFV